MDVPFHDTGSVTVYLGDCRDILPRIDLSGVKALISDPPYGIDWSPKQTMTKGRAGKHPPNRFVGKSIIMGDSGPFDPRHLLGFPVVVLFGANHFADRLPASSAWIVWDKKDGERSMHFGDCEMIWTNQAHPARLISHRWVGYRRGPETGTARDHPTQKPVALMRSIIQRYTEPGDLVLDPYCGSGTTLRAAIDCGRRAIGIEIDPQYMAVIQRRLSQSVMDLKEGAMA